jgi:hypothetical protein
MREMSVLSTTIAVHWTIPWDSACEREQADWQKTPSGFL